MISQSQFKPANQCAQKLGVKSLGYGPPGSAKTPISNTAPRPVMCACEPGLLSMRGSDIPVWEAYSTKEIFQFFEWVEKSNETKNYDTIVVDSVTQMCEIYLSEAKRKYNDGRKHYGYMSDNITPYLEMLYYLKSKHIYLIAKLGLFEMPEGIVKRPLFPGKALNAYVPHLYDLIFHIGQELIQSPEYTGYDLAIRTKGNAGLLARDRSGKLAELEPPNLTYIFNKCMS